MTDGRAPPSIKSGTPNDITSARWQALIWNIMVAFFVQWEDVESQDGSWNKQIPSIFFVAKQKGEQKDLFV